jgi:hypothetical protein
MEQLMSCRKLVATSVIAAACAAPMGAQTFVTDATYSTRLTTQQNGNYGISGEAGRLNVAATMGYTWRIAPRLSLGPVATAGLWSELYLGIGPRISLAASPTITVDVTPSYLISRSGEMGNPRAMLDAAVMYKGKIGLSLQAAGFHQYYFHSDPYTPPLAERRTILFGGVRFGSKPGRVGIAADLLALTAAIAAYAIVCHGGGCD